MFEMHMQSRALDKSYKKPKKVQIKIYSIKISEIFIFVDCKSESIVCLEYVTLMLIPGIQPKLSEMILS